MSVPVGMPRRRARWEPRSPGRGEPRTLPVPWISDRGDETNWVRFQEDYTEAHHKRLCQVCGLPLQRRILFGRYESRRTSGPGAHPRCLRLAIGTCPYLQEQGKIVAYEYVGDGMGYEYDHRFDEDLWEMGMYVVRVDSSCWGLTREEVARVAVLDPLGLVPEQLRMEEIG